ncbi:MAG: c-type cytochrome [Flavobacteriaceae bacterium]|nr:c-type cytochrome [Flavobacteriaceae bacterium]
MITNLGKASIVVAVFLLSFSSNAQSKWEAPTDAKAIVNPITIDKTSIKAGKKMYKQLCAICHGDKGKGDGLASVALNPKPANFLSEHVRKQTDGELFWKITTGNAPMASYKETLTPTQRWQLINFINTLKN